MTSIWDGEDTIAGIVWILTSIAAINWGTVEFIDTNLVGEISTALGSPTVATAIYGAVAIAGVLTLLDHLGAYDVTDVIDSIRGDN